MIRSRIETFLTYLVSQIICRSANVLLGRGPGTGPAQEIAVGEGLEIVNGELNATSPPAISATLPIENPNSEVTGFVLVSGITSHPSANGVYLKSAIANPVGPIYSKDGDFTILGQTYSAPGVSYSRWTLSDNSNADVLFISGDIVDGSLPQFTDGWVEQEGTGSIVVESHTQAIVVPSRIGQILIVPSVVPLPSRVFIATDTSEPYWLGPLAVQS